MNKKYLKENNLYEAHKQFMRLCEWSYVPTMLQEDEPEDDPNAGGAPMGDDPNADPSMGGDPNGGAAPMGGDPSMGGDPNAGGAPMGGDPNADPSMGGDPNGGGAPMGDAPEDGGMPPMDEPPMGGEDPMGEPPMGDEDEVIDVDDITNAQEKVNDKVNTVGKNLGKVDDKISDLMSSIDNMIAKIDSQNQEIETLKQEFNKRNPTPTEKLNLRSLDSYPFNVRPDEYWRDKSATSNYQGYADDEEPTTDEYTITNNDVDDFDERKIADSFFIDDDMKQDINKIFNL